MQDIVKILIDSNSDESNELDDEEQVQPKRKGAKMRFDTYRIGAYC